MLSNELYVIKVNEGSDLWQVRLKSNHMTFSTAHTKDGIKEVIKTLINRYEGVADLKRALGSMVYNRPLSEKAKVKAEKDYKALDPKEVMEFEEYMQSLEKASTIIEGNNIPKAPKKTFKQAPRASHTPSKEVNVEEVKPKKLLKVKKKPIEAKTKVKVEEVKPKIALGLKRRKI